MERVYRLETKQLVRKSALHFTFYESYIGMSLESNAHQHTTKEKKNFQFRTNLLSKIVL